MDFFSMSVSIKSGVWLVCPKCARSLILLKKAERSCLSEVWLMGGGVGQNLRPLFRSLNVSAENLCGLRLITFPSGSYFVVINLLM